MASCRPGFSPRAGNLNKQVGKRANDLDGWLQSLKPQTQAQVLIRMHDDSSGWSRPDARAPHPVHVGGGVKAFAEMSAQMHPSATVTTRKSDALTDMAIAARPHVGHGRATPPADAWRLASRRASRRRPPPLGIVSAVGIAVLLAHGGHTLGDVTKMLCAYED